MHNVDKAFPIKNVLYKECDVPVKKKIKQIFSHTVNFIFKTI